MPFLCVCVFPADMIEKEMRKLFSIPDEKETRLWNRYMTNTFEPLNKPDSTIQDAGLYQGQVRKTLASSPHVANSRQLTVSPTCANESTKPSSRHLFFFLALMSKQVVTAYRGQSNKGLRRHFLLLSLSYPVREIM